MTARSQTRLDRLLRPRSIAVIGGGAWCENVINANRAIGFDGDIWPVHPSRDQIGGLQAYPDVMALPKAPDASFIGINRLATIDTLAQLSARGAGGAVCFASGFAEAAAELDDGVDLQARLIAAADAMPILGPNCYGLLNYLDGVALWPDQHGGTGVASGAAVITQSSNIAINLTMQTRGVPLAYVATAGNQAQTDFAEIGAALLRDPRVTCLGLHIEGIKNIRCLEELAKLSHELNKPICALKIGRSKTAQIATVSHTASLAGSAAGSGALLQRLGITEVDSLPVFLELLKIWHVAGPLRSNAILSASCSGGEASLMADTGEAAGLHFPALTEQQHSGLRAALGPKVALANPLDYHTYIWPLKDRMTETFSAMMQADLALGVVILDFPRADRCDAADWDSVIEAIIAAKAHSRAPMAVLSSLSETLPEEICNRLIAAGIIPLCGIDHAVQAIAKAQALPSHELAVLQPAPPINPRTLDETTAKRALAQFGLRVPQLHHADSPQAAADSAATLEGPLVLKGMGQAHKSEAGLVRLGLRGHAQVLAAAQQMAAPSYLLEPMVTGGLAELLIGVTLDPAHGYVLTLGAGGTQTELLADTVSLLLPVTQSDVTAALDRLRCAPVLHGYRGAPAVDRAAIWRAVKAVQAYVVAHHGQVQEVEINPLICTPQDAVAVDALIVSGDAK